jgi:hypothetical protein
MSYIAGAQLALSVYSMFQKGPDIASLLQISIEMLSQIQEQVTRLEREVVKINIELGKIRESIYRVPMETIAAMYRSDARSLPGMVNRHLVKIGSIVSAGEASMSDAQARYVAEAYPLLHDIRRTSHSLLTLDSPVVLPELANLFMAEVSLVVCGMPFDRASVVMLGQTYLEFASKLDDPTNGVGRHIDRVEGELQRIVSSYLPSISVSRECVFDLSHRLIPKLDPGDQNPYHWYLTEIKYIKSSIDTSPHAMMGSVEGALSESRLLAHRIGLEVDVPDPPRLLNFRRTNASWVKYEVRHQPSSREKMTANVIAEIERVRAIQGANGFSTSALADEFVEASKSAVDAIIERSHEMQLVLGLRAILDEVSLKAKALTQV